MMKLNGCGKEDNVQRYYTIITHTENYMYMLIYLSVKDLSFLIVSGMFGGGALVGHAELVSSMLVEILCLQGFFSCPAPSNFSSYPYV